MLNDGLVISTVHGPEPVIRNGTGPKCQPYAPLSCGLCVDWKVLIHALDERGDILRPRCLFARFDPFERPPDNLFQGGFQNSILVLEIMGDRTCRDIRSARHIS